MYQNIYINLKSLIILLFKKKNTYHWALNPKANQKIKNWIKIWFIEFLLIKLFKLIMSH